MAHCNKFTRGVAYIARRCGKARLFGWERHAPYYEHGRVMRGGYLCAAAPSETLERMTRTELLEAAAEKLVEAAKLLDRADEDTLADDALELAERVNLRISVN